MIVDLGDKLIYIENELNRSILCKSCERKYTINKLINILNRLTNKSYLTVEITHKLSELLETLEMMENCSSCKDEIGKCYYFNEFNKSINDNEINKLINEIEDLLNKLEKEERKGKHDC